MVEVQERRRIGWASIFALSIVIIMQEIPYIPEALGHWTQIPFMLLFVILTFSHKITIKNRNLLFLISTLFYFAIAFCYKMVGISSVNLGYYVHPIAYFFFFISMPTAAEKMSLEQKKFVFCLIILTMLFTLINNWLLNMRYGYAYLLELSRADNLATNVASTQYTSAIMLMGGISLICFLHAKTKRVFWLVMFIALNYFNLVVYQRAIALILSIALYTMILVFNHRYKLYITLLIISVGILLILAVEYYSVVISFISNLIGSDRISRRLNQISKALAARDILQGGGSLTARYELIMRSVNTWLASFRSFFFGAGDHRSTNDIIGNHSQFLDVLGQYGIIVALVFYYSVFKSIKETVGYLPIAKDTAIYRQIICLCCVFAIRGVIGGVLYGTIAIQLFIVLPISISMIKNEGAFSL